jgi:hypothetical protein
VLDVTLGGFGHGFRLVILGSCPEQSAPLN